MNCPNCGAEQFATTECVGCGIIFEKWKGRRDFHASSSHPSRALLEPGAADSGVLEQLLEPPETPRTVRQDALLLGSALLAALLANAIPILRFLLSALVTLVHELGHAVAGWVMGHPSLPAFDFVYGGGITSRAAFQPALAALIAGLIGWTLWRYRGNRRVVIPVAAGGALWLLFVSAEWRRDLVFYSAGHLMELVLASGFLFMALSGRGLRLPELERWPAAFCGFFVMIHSIRFAHRLQTDPEFLSWYRGGKGGMLMNDLESVALDLRIHTSLDPGISGVAGWLIGFSIVPLLAVMLWYLYSRPAR